MAIVFVILTIILGIFFSTKALTFEVVDPLTKAVMVRMAVHAEEASQEVSHYLTFCRVMGSIFFLPILDLKYPKLKFIVSRSYNLVKMWRPCALFVIA